MSLRKALCSFLILITSSHTVHAEMGGMMGGPMIGMWLIWLLVIAVLILAIIWLVKKIRR